MRPDLNLDYALLIVFIVFMGLWPAAFVDRISPTVVNFLPGVG